jgi:hypothetical protein
MAWCIYKHTNKVNGKVYIGQTCQAPEVRWQGGRGYSSLFPFGKAIDKYGWDSFEHEIIEDGLQTVDEANNREIYWISYYHSYVKDPECNGYNATKGGDNREHLGVSVYQLDGESYFIIRKWNTILAASQELGIDHRSIQRVCIGEYRHAGGFCWCFVEDYSENWQVRVDNDKQVVICLETGQEYISAKEASKQTGICYGSITRVCRHQQNKAGGFTWKYKFHDNPEYKPTPTLNDSCRSVWCFEDKIKFASVAEAARYYNLDASGISKCCRGKLRSTGGKHFYYDGDEVNLTQATYGAKPCECLDTGEWFVSASEAARKKNINTTSIAKACAGKQRTAGGLTWRYLNEDEKIFYFQNYLIDWSAASQKNKRVMCVETGNIYETAKQAGETLNINIDMIRKSCNNLSCTAGGYHWQFYID